jgi:hypothetical protein
MRPPGEKRMVEKNQAGGYRLFFILAVICVDEKRPYSALSFLTAWSCAFLLGLELQKFWDGESRRFGYCLLIMLMNFKRWTVPIFFFRKGGKSFATFCIRR